MSSHPKHCRTRILGIFWVILLLFYVSVIFRRAFLPSQPTRISALRGAAWLMDQYDKAPTVDLAQHLIKLYKITDDKGLRRDIRVLMRAKQPKYSASVFTNAEERPLTWDADLLPMIERILWQRCEGKDVSKSSAKIAATIGSHKDVIFPVTIRPSGKLVAAFVLGELGISTGSLKSETVAFLRANPASIMRPLSQQATEYLYGLTHSIFTASAYYSQYVDPNVYQEELSVFRSVVGEFAGVPKLTVQEIDILSEVLISMKLLNEEGNANAITITQTIKKQQRPDGSWGMSGYGEEGIIHHTLVATLALLPFTSVPERRPVYCFRL